MSIMKKMSLRHCLTFLTLVGVAMVSLPLLATGGKGPVSQKVVASNQRLASKSVAAQKIKKPISPLLRSMNEDESNQSVKERSLMRTTIVDKARALDSGRRKSPVRKASLQSTKTFLDSVVVSKEGLSTSKTVYDYDAYGRSILEAYMSFNENTAIWDTTELETRLYDDAGHLLLWIYYEWDESKQQLLPDEKETSVFEYDGENNLLEHQVDYYWDKDNSKWVCNYRGEIVFDGPQREFYKEWTDYSYDSTVGEWMAYRKDLQYRNVNGYSYQYEYYDWDDSLKIWIGKEKYGYVSDEVTGEETLYSQYYWSDSLREWSQRTDETYLPGGILESKAYFEYAVSTQTWSPDIRYVYDKQGDQWFDELTIEQQWNAAKSDWVNDSKTGYEYDSERGDTSKYVRYDWDVEASIWKGVTYWEKSWYDYGNLQSLNRYSYSSNNGWVMTYELWLEYDNLTNDEWLITYSWESEYYLSGEQAWFIQFYRYSSLEPWIDEYTFKRTFQFHENGLRSITRTYDWDETNQVWVNYSKREYTINEAGDYAYSIFYDWEVTDWVERNRTTYFYSQRMVGVQSIEVKLEVYPNPVADCLKIKGATQGELIKVFDLNGRIVRMLKVDGEEASVNMANVPAGTYLVQVGKQVVKIIK
jgi:hypothetical protein